MLLLEQHVACAALETAVLPGEDEAIFGATLQPVLASLAAAGEGDAQDSYCLLLCDQMRSCADMASLVSCATPLMASDCAVKVSELKLPQMWHRGGGTAPACDGHRRLALHRAPGQPSLPGATLVHISCSADAGGQSLTHGRVMCRTTEAETCRG